LEETVTIIHRNQTTNTRQAFFSQQVKHLLADVHNLNIADAEKGEIHDLLVKVNRIAGGF
jgi:hypothetical protein